MANEFRNQFTVAQIKQQAGSAQFNVYKNPDNEAKRSWRCGTLHGPVATAGYGDAPVVSELVDTDTGLITLMLHKLGTRVQTEENKCDSL